MRCHKLTMLLLAGLLMTVEARAIQPLNLIRDGNFELNWSPEKNEAPAFWHWYSENETSATLACGKAPRTGAGNVYIRRNGSGGNTGLDNSNTMVPVHEGADYTYKYAVKGSGQLSVCLGWRDHHHTEIGKTIKTYPLTDTYILHDVTLSAPENAAEAWISFSVSGSDPCFYVDDVAMWLNPGPEYYTTGYVNLNQDNFPSSNLTLVSVPGDGNTYASVQLDKECRATLNDSSGHAMYFNVADTFIHNRPTSVSVTVEYADMGTDTFCLVYDAAGGEARKKTASVTKANTLEWKKTTFYLCDALFDNGLDGGADFCISDNGDGKESINYVAVTNWDGARIVDNHLEINGVPTFLKLGWAGSATSIATGTIEQMVAKGYNASHVSCYQCVYDKENDKGGSSYESLTGLNDFLTSGSESGLYQGLDWQTANVGGGGTPEYLFDWYDMQAKNSKGALVVDDEYGTKLKVESLMAPGFLNRGRCFISWVLENIDLSKMTWYETPVEPQYMGNQWLDYSTEAYNAWHIWLAWRYSLASLNAQWGTGYTAYDKIPMPTESSDPAWSLWQTWRSYALADWVNGDIQTIRNVVGEKALVAVDTLIVTQMEQRMGVPFNFCDTIYPNVFQVNWTWLPGGPPEWNHTPWDEAWDLVTPIAKAKNIALSEHMTLNGQDYSPDDVDAILRRTLAHGNRFGWYFTKSQPVSSEAFSLYNDDWSPKPLINVIDSNNEKYMDLARSHLLDSIPDVAAKAVAKTPEK